MTANPALAVPMLRYLAAGIALGEAGRGVRETSPNWSRDIRLYLLNCEPKIHTPVPWCAAFIQYCTDAAARRAGIANPLDDVKREAYVPDYFALAKQRGWVVPSTMADVGDLVLFEWATGPRRWNHIGIVARPPDLAGMFQTIEGNTGGPEQDQRDGDGVYAKTRNLHFNYKTCFIRWDMDARVPPDAALTLAPVKRAA